MIQLQPDLSNCILGYGHITPKTALGQMMVIPFALLGIPLMLMFLANIGDFMARSFRLGYTRGCCFVCWRRRKKNYDVDKERRNRLKAEIQEAQGELESDKNGTDVGGEKGSIKGQDKGIDLRIQSPSSDSNESNFPDEMPDDEFLNVPISLTIVVAIMYLFIGAILFATWNGWSWIQGAYFSFVTLSTIGFGDYVPGWQEASTPIGRLKLVVSSLYIVFGLAVLSMSFNLMMDEMISKFKWLGRQMGIIKKLEAHKELIIERSPPPDDSKDAEKTSNEIRIENHPEGRQESGVQDMEEVEEIR